MRVTLIGLGGAAATLTHEAQEALERADVIVGAARLLDGLPKREKQKYFTEYKTEEIAAILERQNAESACVVFSGDTGFYSGAAALLPRLRERGYDCRVLAGLSSVQLLAARLGRSWQDWTLRSAHGVACDPVAAVLRGSPAFFLTGGANT
ncbi:MAG: cobalt-precorrin-7 (C(5))-methyltransferase, partial [Oscillospiraceae bacterium]|nr:cobalt-precorrin-7 (C(5))-methyltransferase [Oscillospiraceae bacterium]